MVAFKPKQRIGPVYGYVECHSLLDPGESSLFVCLILCFNVFSRFYLLAVLARENEPRITTFTSAI